MVIRKRRVAFWTLKSRKVPIRVKFVDKYGNIVSFEARKTIKRPVKVSFYTKQRRRRR